MCNHQTPEAPGRGRSMNVSAHQSTTSQCRPADIGRNANTKGHVSWRQVDVQSDVVFLCQRKPLTLLPPQSFSIRRLHVCRCLVVPLGAGPQVAYSSFRSHGDGRMHVGDAHVAWVTSCGRQFMQKFDIPRYFGWFSNAGQTKKRRRRMQTCSDASWRPWHCTQVVLFYTYTCHSDLHVMQLINSPSSSRDENFSQIVEVCLVWSNNELVISCQHWPRSELFLKIPSFNQAVNAFYARCLYSVCAGLKSIVTIRLESPRSYRWTCFFRTALHPKQL